jgi:3-deoxy-D-manno-octulosonic-acid transferase
MPCIAALLSYCALLFVLLFLLTHPKLRAGHAARFGFYRRPLPPKRHRRIWMHGASAGDVLALLPTARALKWRQPQLEVIASTITNSGHAMACANLDLFGAVIYAPLDLPGAVNRALDAIAPDVLLLEYTELWPNLIHAARRRGVALVLHNGRFSAARLQRYRWLFAAVGNLLRPFCLILVRDDAEAERAFFLGAPPQVVHVTGNTKFDNLGDGPPAATVKALREATGLRPKDLVWVAGSTHEGEEELLLGVFMALRQTYPSLRLVLAPRYTERCPRLRSLCARRGLETRLRSAGPRDRTLRPSTGPDDGPAVWILDTIGELGACYALASLVFVGGSFSARGGQNILEPAACGKPVLFGPNMENFADSVQVLLGRGGLQVNSARQLHRVISALLNCPAHLQELGQTAQSQVRAVRGAAARNAALIEKQLLSPAEPSG